MRYASVCSGIEAPTVAWEPLGWEPVWFSEIEKFPSAVLAHHCPQVPNLGDCTRIGDGAGEFDLLVGGTPCQPFSVAGNRRSTDDPRAEPTIAFARLVRSADSFAVWENVPGVLSAKGNPFGCLLAALVGEDAEITPSDGNRKWTRAGVAYGPEGAASWRVLDAQYFGLAQRRKRVFVVRCPRNGPDPAEILFEREGMRRDSAPSREAGSRVAGTHSASTKACGFAGQDVHNDRLVVHARQDPISSDKALPLDTDGASQAVIGFKPMQSASARSLGEREEQSPTLEAAGGGNVVPAVCFDTTQITSPGNVSNPKPGDPCHPLAHGAYAPAITGQSVRRLTPLECERLQGFPDDYTLIPGASDTARYRAIGNSMAVPVVRWIGERIQRVKESPCNPT